VLISIVGSLIIVPLFFYDLTGKVKTFIISFLLLSTISFYLLIFGSDSVLIALFKGLIELITEGYSDDISANARVIQTIVAIQNIKDYPYFGIGMISSGERGLEYYYGRIYPSDIGIIGVAFKFGLIGSLYIYTQFFLVIWVLLKKKIQNINNQKKFQVELLIYMNTYMLLISLFTGRAAFSPFNTLLFGIMLFVYYPFIFCKNDQVDIGFLSTK
jgi:hypothetical protein